MKAFTSTSTLTWGASELLTKWTDRSNKVADVSLLLLTPTFETLNSTISTCKVSNWPTLLISQRATWRTFLFKQALGGTLLVTAGLASRCGSTFWTKMLSSSGLASSATTSSGGQHIYTTCGMTWMNHLCLTSPLELCHWQHCTTKQMGRRTNTETCTTLTEPYSKSHHTKA